MWRSGESVEWRSIVVTFSILWERLDSQLLLHRGELDKRQVLCVARACALVSTCWSQRALERQWLLRFWSYYDCLPFRQIRDEWVRRRGISHFFLQMMSSQKGPHTLNKHKLINLILVLLNINWRWGKLWLVSELSGAETAVWANPGDAISSMNSYNTTSEGCKVASPACAQDCCHRAVLQRSVF